MACLGTFDKIEPTPWTLPVSADAQIEPTERFTGPGHLGLETVQFPVTAKTIISGPAHVDSSSSFRCSRRRCRLQVKFSHHSRSAMGTSMAVQRPFTSILSLLHSRGDSLSASTATSKI